MNKAINYSKSFSELTVCIQDFVEAVEKQQLQNMATDEWTVKDVLCHITYWHQYYADQYASLSAGTKPFVFTSKGGSTRNQNGVDSLKSIIKRDLIQLLYAANSSLHASIVINQIPEMNYTDRKKYSTKDFLDIVIGHIRRHTIQVRRAKGDLNKAH